MKHIIIAATAASLVAVGLAACGSHSAPEASPIPTDKGCVEIAKPSDPHGLIPSDGWPFPACSALSDVQPGVDQGRAQEIAYDARQRVVAAKREIIFLAAQGNQLVDIETNSDATVADYRDRISDVRGRIADDLMASSLALKGTPPAGFELAYVKGNDIHSASPAWTGRGR
ncbi:Uncharacterised protein [Mycobacteroides abscessus subsp. abscessus]|uniref:hypothetical protein n=1 Tax=Mycobacteroides abscessus TaxID=36809 RepID=UPI0009286A0C|nr:hypothetical protein [Mycobacteroides abscessus]MBE5451219.1 hypothetical protein [Mycobacteroides abscessus]SHW53111.1 Uncharacterised protein [Mycobacteroides abscessus subsp. abscessus]SHX58387.1 Uncharacterised protein [Mycobacteroides abscessus subsp. abscessus]SIE78544.1 Uncharacterised protein [Mycobacteroides abscessus subsp. abscessus]SII21754.1 Uncharacterised protein [Mycobacteroides abscessus subsp. abscessus]